MSKWLQPVGLVAAAAFVWLVVAVNSNTSAMYRGGFLLVAVIVALLIWSVVARPEPPSPPGCRWGLSSMSGGISYGLYLWHWPTDVALDQTRRDCPGGLFSSFAPASPSHWPSPPITSWSGQSGRGISPASCRSSAAEGAGSTGCNLDGHGDGRGDIPRDNRPLDHHPFSPRWSNPSRSIDRITL